MSIENNPGDALPPRADLLSALAWIAFGGAIAVGAWNMDRLEHLHINKYEIPGLVPGLLGAVIALLGMVLAMRSIGRGALGPQHRTDGTGLQARMALVFAMTMGYALLLIGTGLPFWLGTFVFVTAFIHVFDAPRGAELKRSRAQQLGLACVYGAATSAIVTLVFENVFLVRLP